MKVIKALLFCVIVLFFGNTFAEDRTSLNFSSYNSFYDLQKTRKLSKSLTIFSSRDYITEILKSKETPEIIYWVLPVDELKKEDADIFLDHIKGLYKVLDIKFSAEGLEISFEKTQLYIMLNEKLSMINLEYGDVIIDVDYFFRSFKSDIKTPKVESVVSVFNSFRQLEWKIKNIYLIKSLDINLPDWVQEYAFIVSKVYDYWNKKIFPKPLLALDFVDQALYYFAQYEEAYQVLKEVENFHKDNPYFYHRLFIASIRSYKDNDVLYSAKRAYELDREMIKLYFEGADYLVSKTEIYPAYVLLNEGIKVEPWNVKLKEKLNQVIELGYNYYNSHEGNEELFEFFKKEFEKINRLK
ncbi:MAG: hypothetical protein N2202_09430 [Proteobacteria bacterium]|nr:hypothetical protein [Pseudomonadota bacterium]